MDDDAIRQLLHRLARVHPSGGSVVERVAIVAEGSGSDSVFEWMFAHGAQAEATPPPAVRHGLHEAGWRTIGAASPSAPSRYILPAGALD
ncbi:MAG TPA: hypothetical protein VM253_07360 [Candidatus Limnocylindrales bacterium]|nr:hypothetical protein [Candidatus Limnocylindrales bacterium]HWI09517.1 hypothetical protein [Solirubrobacteraceae bacterium]